jgi:hypothetical protein
MVPRRRPRTRFSTFAVNPTHTQGSGGPGWPALPTRFAPHQSPVTSLCSLLTSHFLPLTDPRGDFPRFAFHRRIVVTVFEDLHNVLH